MLKKIILCFLVFALVSTLSSCRPEGENIEKFSETLIDYFDTVSTIVGYDKSQEAFDSNIDFIEKELSEYHKLYDIYKSYSGINNLCTVNENAGKSPVKVDAKIIELLDECIKLYDATKGYTNVAMGSVLSIWHDYRTNGINDPENAELPPKSKLTEAAKYTDISKIIIDRDNSTVFLSDPNMSLDVGAIAKGYSTERIAQALLEKGISGYTLNIGGNIRTLGSKPNGENWTASVVDPNPDSETGSALVVELSGNAFVTSGSYQRYYEVDGKQYHHIISPETLMPLNNFVSVSVACNDSGLADALSTALFNMSFEEGRKLASDIDNLEAMWITDKYEILYTEGFEKFIRN